MLIRSLEVVRYIADKIASIEKDIDTDEAMDLAKQVLNNAGYYNSRFQDRPCSSSVRSRQRNWLRRRWRATRTKSCRKY